MASPSYTVACAAPGRDVHWPSVEKLSINSFPWYESGLQQSTEVQLALQDDVLIVKAYCSDVHCSAVVSDLNGPVYTDSCFELFLSPWENSPTYFNFEVNCIGTLHLAIGEGREGRRLSSPEEAAKVQISGTHVGKATKACEDRGGADDWDLLVKIPLTLLEDMSGSPLGCRWRGNLYRCGGPDDQYASWSSVGTDQPDYHRPEYFGTLELSGEVDLK